MNEVTHASYNLGAKAIVVLRFVNIATGVAADPSSFELKVQRRHARTVDPVVAYTQTSPETVKQSTGLYYVTLPEFNRNTVWGSGKYFVTCDGDGLVEAGYRSWFKVNPSPII